MDIIFIPIFFQQVGYFSVLVSEDEIFRNAKNGFCKQTLHLFIRTAYCIRFHYWIYFMNDASLSLIGEKLQTLLQYVHEVG